MNYNSDNESSVFRMYWQLNNRCIKFLAIRREIIKWKCAANGEIYNAYKQDITDINKGRKRKTNKISALKKSVNAVIKESENRKYTETDRDTIRQLIGMLNEILENQEG